MTRQVLIAFGLVVVASVAWWMWRGTSVPAESLRRPVARPFVRVVGKNAEAEDRLLAERAKYFDPTPLFIPTPQNYGRGGLPRRLRKQPGEIFGDYDAKLSATFPKVEKGPATDPLSDILSRANEVPFAGLGERPTEVAPVPPRAAQIEIKSLVPGRFSRSEAIQDANPPRRDFAPMEFLVTVGTAGLVGDPVVVEGSGWAEVDSFFRDFLVRRYALGAKLSPGRYRVLVGP